MNDHSKSLDLRWWLKEEDAHLTVFDTVKKIRDNTDLLRRKFLYFACMYGDTNMAGVLGKSNLFTFDFEPSRLAFNVVRRTVSTLTAKIAKNKPLPMPLTSGGTRAAQQRAKDFGRLIEGSFDEAKVWRKSPVVARDAGLFGTGITFNYRDGDKICHERVFPWEVHIDPREEMYGEPRNVYLRRWVDRLVLTERFPDSEADIDQAQNRSDPDDITDIGYDDTCDLVLVEEAWHLPSGKGAKDGWHIICVSNKTLVKESYNKDYFPLCFLQMEKPLSGCFGTGLAEMLTGIQYTINETAEMVQERMRMAGGFVLVENSSDVQTDHIDNSGQSILRYTRTRPEWITPEPVHPDLYNFLERLIPQSYQQSGISELSANSQLPKGMKDASGVAINTYNDIETERFAMFARGYEEYHIDLAWQFFDLMEEISKDYPDYKVSTPVKKAGDRRLIEFKYKDVRLDRKEFQLFVYPTSMFSKEPAAKIQEIQALAQTGALTGEDVLELIDYPDFQKRRDLNAASRELIESVIENMLDAKDPLDPEAYIPPEEFMDLELCSVIGLQEYQKAKMDGVSLDNLNLIADFIKDSKDLLDAKAADSQPPPPPVDPNALPPMPLAAPGVDPNMVPPGVPAPPPMMPAPPGVPGQVPPM